jgi:hypothetical protein
MPVTDRAADTWEPLIALADTAGNEWGKRARGAMVAAHEVAVQEQSVGSYSTALSCIGFVAN